MNYLIVVSIISLAVLAHELGHFLAAKRVEIPVRLFSVGFGPRLWGFCKGGTEYRLSLIPLGGYILPDIEDESDYFRIPAEKRAFMAAGGPLANIILAMLCLSAINACLNGISFTTVFLKPPVQAVSLLYQMAASIPLLFSSPGELSGVVGIVAQGGRYIEGGILYGLEFLALMNLNLALVNLLPVPALDGGKIVLHLMERIHPGLFRLHFPLSVAGWVLVMGLMLYVTASDIVRVF